MPLTSTTWKINVHKNAQTVLISTTLPSTARPVMKSVLRVLEMRSTALHATSLSNYRANVSAPVLLITMLKMEIVRLVHLKSKAVLHPCPLMSNKPLKTSSPFSSSSSTRKSRSMVTPKTLLKSGSPWNPEEEDSHKPDLSSKAKPTSSMKAWNSKLKSCPTEPWNSNSTLECHWKMSSLTSFSPMPARFKPQLAKAYSLSNLKSKLNQSKSIQRVLWLKRPAPLSFLAYFWVSPLWFQYFSYSYAALLLFSNNCKPSNW